MYPKLIVIIYSKAYLETGTVFHRFLKSSKVTKMYLTTKMDCRREMHTRQNSKKKTFRSFIGPMYELYLTDPGTVIAEKIRQTLLEDIGLGAKPGSIYSHSLNLETGFEAAIFVDRKIKIAGIGTIREIPIQKMVFGHQMAVYRFSLVSQRRL